MTEAPDGSEQATSGWSRLAQFLKRVPRQDRARSVVNALLDAADDDIEVAEAGPLQRVFHRAGVAAGSFYEYFPSREALLAASIERLTQRNFERYVAEAEAALQGEPSLEQSFRRGVAWMAEQYMIRPAHLRAIVRIGDRLGLLAHVNRERDRFAIAVGERMKHRLPATLTDDARGALFCAMADASMGVIIVAAYRAPVPDRAEVGRRAADVAWALLARELERHEPRRT